MLRTRMALASVCYGCLAAWTVPCWNFDYSVYGFKAFFAKTVQFSHVDDHSESPDSFLLLIVPECTTKPAISKRIR